MTITPPSFNLLWVNYPTGTAAAVKSLIGGNVNATWITNTCAIRLSHALNAAGHSIPRGLPWMETVSGGDKSRYAFRVAELTRYLTMTFGDPEVVKKQDQPASAAREAVAGRRGIVVFEVSGWEDATGHIDLWDGSRIRGQEYFESARRVLFWEMK